MKYVLALAAAVVLVGLSNAASFKTKALFNRFQALHKRDDNDSNPADEEKCEIIEDQGEKENCWKKKEFHWYWHELNRICKEVGVDREEHPRLDGVCGMVEHMNERLAEMTGDEQFQYEAEQVGIANRQHFKDLYGYVAVNHYKVPTYLVCNPDDVPDIVLKLETAFDNASSSDKKRNTNIKNLLEELTKYSKTGLLKQFYHYHDHDHGLHHRRDWNDNLQ